MASGPHHAVSDFDIMRPPSPAGKSLDRAQAALGQAARTERKLRDSLKRHRKALSTVEDDLGKRRHDLKTMKSQLKVAKKARKRAARKLGHAKPTPSHG
ncbi:MAG TPA: hypothetical protein VHY31_03535 [Streptosporangiaceae bacterium]|jgi:septal ring factor EnvC (AmiA/AmiB activator)|nr:hypothetical protein [Streptosporangiaceae bacterium]